MEVADALKRFRHEFGLSQRKVADLVGILPQAYSRYENGQYLLPTAAVLKLATTYNVSADYLLGLSDNPRPPDTAALVAAINDAQKILSGAIENRSE